MMRFLPSDSRASSGNTSSPPAMPTSSDTQRDARDLRLVPFLEVHARPAREPRGARAHGFDAGLEFFDELRGLRLATHHAAQHRDHAQDLRHAALIEHVHFDAGADQLRGDVRLQIGEAEHQVGLQFHDLVDLRAGECRDLAASRRRARRPHGEAGDADDARSSPSR